MTALLKRPPSDAERVYLPPDGTGSGTTGLGELDVVELLTSSKTLDGADVPAGTVGTIVTVWGQGTAFDVEFLQPAGLVSVGPEDLKLA